MHQPSVSGQSFSPWRSVQRGRPARLGFGHSSSSPPHIPCGAALLSVLSDSGVNSMPASTRLVRGRVRVLRQDSVLTVKEPERHTHDRPSPLLPKKRAFPGLGWWARIARGRGHPEASLPALLLFPREGSSSGCKRALLPPHARALGPDSGAGWHRPLAQPRPGGQAAATRPQSAHPNGVPSLPQWPARSAA